MENDKQKLIGDVKIPAKTLLKRSWRYFKSVKWSLLLALFVIMINVGFDTVLPLIYRNVIDNLQDEVNIALKIIVGGAILFAIISIVNQCFRFVESYILQKAGNNIVYQLRVETFEHIEKMSLDQFEIMPVGSLVTRVANYTAQMSDLFTNQIVNLIRNIFSIIAVFGIMIFISPILSLVVLGIGIIVLFISLYFRKRISKLSRLEKGYISDLNTTLSEDFQGMKIIQLFNQENSKKDEFFIKNKRMRDARFGIMMNFSFYRPFIGFLQNVAVALALFAGAGFALSAGSIVAFYVYIQKFFEPVQNLSDQFVHIERALTSSERLFNLLDVNPHVVDKGNAREIKSFNGKIEFKHVWFSYDNKNWVLKDVSFVVNKGETCAFVGATGAGKTTILSLLVKSYIPQKGQILIDDVDINDIKISSLRKGIGQMLQDVFLFSGNIKSNVTLFDDSYSDLEIKSAMRYVNADSFVNQLEKGVMQEVVERGDNFSQGQRQLLSFARTILHKPQILLLDEATANIDTETEVLIQDSLEKMKSLGTMLVVAHRLSTIKNSDQIICLQNGEIVERGTHQSLLRQKGYYYKLNELQFK